MSNADLILHVVDVSCAFYDKQMQVVEEVLESLHAADIPGITIYNKCDALSGDRLIELSNSISLSDERPTIIVSAKRGDGISELLALIEKKLNACRHEIELIIPYAQYEAISFIHDKGMLLSEEHMENGTKVRALIDEADIGQLRKILRL